MILAPNGLVYQNSAFWHLPNDSRKVLFVYTTASLPLPSKLLPLDLVGWVGIRGWGWRYRAWGLGFGVEDSQDIFNGFGPGEWGERFDNCDGGGARGTWYNRAVLCCDMGHPGLGDQYLGFGV